MDDAFRALLPRQSEQEIAALVSEYRDRYAELGYAENTLYEGVVDALHTLSAKGLRLGVCTSKREDFARKILDLFGIRSLFEFVDGGDVGVSKVQQVEVLCSNGFIDPRAKMIGDRAVDVSAARQNGLSSVGVLWGYGSRAELTEAGAHAILEDTKELSQLSRAP